MKRLWCGAIVALAGLALVFAWGHRTFAGHAEAEAPPSVQNFVLTDLDGTIDPVTYTDADGTFTTSEITPTLNSVYPTIVSIDETTGLITNDLVLDVAFNNGKPGGLNADLSGTVSMHESGQLLPPDDDFCLLFPDALGGCADLTIGSGVLSGAGPFNDTAIKGGNPTIIIVPWPPLIVITWRFGGSSTSPDILIDLPSPPFIGGENIEIRGELTASLSLSPPPVVGGIARLQADGDAPTEASASSPSDYAAPIAAAVAAGALALAAGGWYVRRRFRQRRI